MQQIVTFTYKNGDDINIKKSEKITITNSQNYDITYEILDILEIHKDYFDNVVIVKAMCRVIL